MEECRRCGGDLPYGVFGRVRCDYCGAVNVIEVPDAPVQKKPSAVKEETPSQKPSPQPEAKKAPQVRESTQKKRRSNLLPKLLLLIILVGVGGLWMYDQMTRTTASSLRRTTETATYTTPTEPPKPKISLNKIIVDDSPKKINLILPTEGSGDTSIENSADFKIENNNDVKITVMVLAPLQGFQEGRPQCWIMNSDWGVHIDNLGYRGFVIQPQSSRYAKLLCSANRVTTDTGNLKNFVKIYLYQRESDLYTDFRPVNLLTEFPVTIEVN